MRIAITLWRARGVYSNTESLWIHQLFLLLLMVWFNFYISLLLFILHCSKFFFGSCFVAVYLLLQEQNHI